MDRGLKALASKGLYGLWEHGLRGRRGRGEEKKEKRGPGRSPGAIFSKCVFTLSPGLVGDCRLCFWTPLTEIFVLVKFQPDRGPPAQGPKTRSEPPPGGSWLPPARWACPPEEGLLTERREATDFPEKK